MLIPKSYKHNRKDTKKRPMNAEEKAHAERLVQMGCLICGAAPTLHHERRYGRPTNHKLIVPLCPSHHQIQFGKESLEYLGHDEFERRHSRKLGGLSLSDWASNQWKTTKNMLE